jgi:hypothetical protein
MNITINQVESNTADGIVITAHWNAILTEGDFSASAYGSAGFTRDEESPILIPFADVTEADVINWVKESMISTKDIAAVMDEEGVEITPATTETVDGVADLEANLQAQIDEQKNPIITSGKPWAPVIEEVEAA